MTITIEALDSAPGDAEALGVLVFEGEEASSALPPPEQRRRRGFSAKSGETLVHSPDEGPLAVLVGLGRREALDDERLRRAGAALVRAAGKCATVAVDLGPLGERGAQASSQALAEGAALASYRFVRLKSDPGEAGPKRLVLFGAGRAELEAGARRASVIADGVCLARDLVNTPAGELTPARFADIAREVGEEHGVAVEVLDEAAIAEAGLGGLMGVAAGSAEPPRLVRATYDPPGGASTHVAIVGKGITFDSGGLSLKPAGSMMTMKTDMSGAAAVLGTVSCLPALGVGVKVSGYMPAAENMPGGRAVKPGDVLKIRNGKTIEVLNTDAEGRLILADALSLAVEEGPDAIVDLATLTGACVAALGREIAGVLGNDDRLIAAVRAAARRAGEAMWPLPLPAGYRSHIDSEVADMKNIGVNGQAGALSAALLLAEFVGDRPWVHLDIAGPARSEDDRGYLKKGGTGYGVRTLVELLSGYEALGSPAGEDAEGVVVLR